MTDVSAPVDESTLLGFVQRWHAAWNSHDPEQVFALCTDDYEQLDPTSDVPQHGLPALRAMIDTLGQAMPDFRFDSSSPPLLEVTRGVAIVPWRLEGTMTGPLEPPGFAPTNGRIAIEGDDHWQLRDGRVARCRVLYDQMQVALQIGAVPRPGTLGDRFGVWMQRLASRGLRRRNR